ncbi:MAG: HAD-IA family hydrolase [Bacteroidota bacterium]
MIKLIIFDMAGTSIQEHNLVYRSIQNILQEAGQPTSLAAVLEHGAGKEKWQAIFDTLKAVQGVEPDHDRVTVLHEQFKTRLEKAYDTHEMEVFPGVLAVIEALRPQGIKIGFNTGYKKATAEKILQKVGIAVPRDIDALATADMVSRGRPAPDMIQLICEKLNIPAEQSIKVGDSAIDIAEGKNAGVAYTIGVTTGAQTRPQLSAVHPDYIFDDMRELLEKWEDLAG